MCQIVTRDKKESTNIGRCLEHAVNGVKGNACPWSKCFWFLVLVMAHVNVLVHPFVGVECTVHPINADFNAGKVKHHGRDVLRPAANFVNGKICSGPPGFHKKFIQDRQEDIDEHALLRESNLMPNRFRRRPLPIFENSPAHGVNVAKIMKDTTGSIVHKHGPNKISEIAQDVVGPFNPDFENQKRNKPVPKKERIDPRIEIATRIFQRSAV